MMRRPTTFARCVAVSFVLFAGSAKAQTNYDGTEAPQPTQNGAPVAGSPAPVVNLAPTPRYTVNFEMAGFVSYAISAPYYNIVGGGLELGATGIIGMTEFPDAQGGIWHGIAVQAFFRPWGGGFWNSATGGGYFSLFGGAGVGYAFMDLRAADPNTVQKGIGVMATYRIGESNTWFFGDSSTVIGGQSYSTFTHGPWIALLFPKYRTRDGHLGYGFLNADIVFSGAADQGLTFLELGGGGAF